MPRPLQLFLGFAIGFGVWEALAIWLGDAPFALGPFLLDSLVPAAIAAAVLWAIERRRARKTTSDR